MSQTIQNGLLCLVLLILSIGDATAQTADIELRKACEDILLDEYARLDSKQTSMNALPALALLRQVSHTKSRIHLLKRLDSDSIHSAVAAAELLITKDSTNRNNKAVMRVMDGLKPETSSQRVAIIRVRALLGNQQAIKTLHDWAALQFAKLPIATSHACPMMCVKPADKPGRCPVCGMKMLQMKTQLTDNDFLAQQMALQTLQELGDKQVTVLAKRVLLSNASAWYRLNAAYIWCLVEPERASPHLKLFLDSEHYRSPALSFFVEANPQGAKEVLQKLIAENDEKDLLGRYDAFRGMIKLGDRQYLERVRSSIDDSDNKDGSNLGDFYNISLLAEFGSKDDIIRLKNLLDSKYKVNAAQAILAILNRG